MKHVDIIIVGAGAAGTFAAIHLAQALPEAKILLIEAQARTLTKVKISGGGRCNVTHQQWDRKELVKNYPRGQKELLSVFARFAPQDTLAFFASHGVELKAEADGRMFPTTDKSETIIACLEGLRQSLRVELLTQSSIRDLALSDGRFILKNKRDELFSCEQVLLATGSAPEMYSLLEKLGHQIVEPVPSLFTFQCQDELLQGMAGQSFPWVEAELRCGAVVFRQQGPLLITHWGLSGPAILKLSAFAARELFQAKYEAQLSVNWLPSHTPESLRETLQDAKKKHPKKKISNECPFTLSKRFWEAMLHTLGLSADLLYADLSKKAELQILEKLTKTLFVIKGKGVFKEEFVTAGGVALKEVDLKTMQSKLCPGLFFAGELLNVDGITGGFNFQNAWSSGYIAAQGIAAARASESKSQEKT